MGGNGFELKTDAEDAELVDIRGEEERELRDVEFGFKGDEIEEVRLLRLMGIGRVVDEGNGGVVLVIVPRDVEDDEDDSEDDKTTNTGSLGDIEASTKKSS
ncbi:hypothetical protein H0H93_005054 [Arthromyces matolae]|nr:hypothetical protein H0H93_005054 [Arthromyces matolae]